MNNQVKVTKHPETGAVVTPAPSNPDYGYVRVESKQLSFEGGFARMQTRSALIRMEMELAQYFTENQILEGKIVVKESLTPFYEGQTPKINPSNSDILHVNGSPIYRTTEFVTDANAQDVLLQHTNVATAITVEESEVTETEGEQF